MEESLKNSSNVSVMSQLIDSQMQKISHGVNVYETGVVTVVKEFILYVTGFKDISFHEEILVGDKGIGYISKIEQEYCIVSMLQIKKRIAVGDVVSRTNKEYKGKYSYESFGRIIDIFGHDILTNKKFLTTEDITLEKTNIPIMDRTDVKRPLLSGICGIDLIYPIGKGQRQLIIGDKKTGKTQIALDTIVNQKGKDMICFYVAIGKTKKDVKEIYYELLKRGAMEYTIIITAFNDELPPVLCFTPYFALSVADNYMKLGYDCLVVLDDLKKHADAYREISLMSGKPPGRDAYPSDIFYLHSRLLEKGCQYKNGASITILPIMETRGGDITDYISTNVISICDGQLVMSDKNFQKGIKPAIDYGLSVSRLGGAVQNPDVKALGAKVRQELLSYLETKDIYELSNMDEMSPEIRNKIKVGSELLDNLIQYKYSPLSEEQIIEKFTDIL